MIVADTHCLRQKLLPLAGRFAVVINHFQVPTAAAERWEK